MNTDYIVIGIYMVTMYNQSFARSYIQQFLK